MLALLIRGIIIYFIVIASVRLMGKRQIGELQPAELVITILLSDIASMPLQNADVPLIQCIVSVFLLVSLEVIFSVITIKSRPLRTLIQGHSIMVIEKGKPVQKNMKKMRYSVDDLIEALRLKDVFDISTVEYAYIETNGSISVMLKKSSSPVTVQDMGKNTKQEALPCLVISDGKIIKREFDVCSLTVEKLNDILAKKKLSADDILIMTYACDGKTNIIKKEKTNV